jgi:hypothetical protein
MLANAFTWTMHACLKCTRQHGGARHSHTELAGMLTTDFHDRRQHMVPR